MSAFHDTSFTLFPPLFPLVFWLSIQWHTALDSGLFAQEETNFVSATASFYIIGKRSSMPNSKKISLSGIVAQFLREEFMGCEEAIEVVQQAAFILRAEPNVLQIDDPIVTVGDIQGQFYDLMKVFALGGAVDNTKYLFLGNYIGNGGFNLECIVYLLAAKITYPNSIFLLRGCNESKFMADVIGLGLECERKCCKNLLPSLISVFNCFPLAAVVVEKYFCVHAGLSPDVSHIEDIALIHRFRQIPTCGAMCDLVWSEPDWDMENLQISNVDDNSGDAYVPRMYPFETKAIFIKNKQRGVSYVFNFSCARRFVSANNLLCIIRGHDIQDNGFNLHRPHPNHIFPCVISLFSAPNYSSTFGNKGAILIVSKETLGVKQFGCSPHPCILQGKNAFSWSLPFLESSLMSIFLALLSTSDLRAPLASCSECDSDDDLYNGNSFSC